MNRIFGIFLFLAIVVVGLGFYRGWFSLSRSDTSTDTRQVDVNLRLDGDKLQEDIDAMKQSATDSADKIKEGTSTLGDKVKNDE